MLQNVSLVMVCGLVYGYNGTGKNTAGILVDLQPVIGMDS